jgi:hypothetical protein
MPKVDKKRWFDWCGAYLRARADVRVIVSSGTHYNYRRIASLPPKVGALIDDVGVSYSECVYIVRNNPTEMLGRLREVVRRYLPEHHADAALALATAGLDPAKLTCEPPGEASAAEVIEP